MKLSLHWNNGVVLRKGAWVKRAALAAALMWVLAPCAFAQNIGSVLGTVKDHTGAVIPGAKVVATSNLTGINYDMVTNSLGDYYFPSLPEGVYTFKVSAPSFRELQIERIEVHVGSTVRQDAVLMLASVTTKVEVVSSTPLVNSETSEIGMLTYSEQITNLPLNGRDVYGLIFLTPGTDSNDEATGNTEKPSVAGGRPGFAVYYIDGININGHNTVAAQISPTVDAVQEFRFETQMAPASEPSSSNIRVALKSGTNQYHGTAYDFLRNNVLDAHPYFQVAISAPGYNFQPEQLRQNQFGGTLGGPILKDKLFFFVSYQAQRVRTSDQATALYPTAAMLAGDFTGINPETGAAGKTFGTVYDPTTYAGFPGNQVPSTRFSSFANKFNSLIPAANCMVCLADGLGFDFVGSSPGYNNADAGIARVDYHISSKDMLAGSVDINDSRTSEYVSAVEVSRGQLMNRGTLVTLSETHTFSPTLLNEVLVGYLRRPGVNEQQGNAEGAYTFLNTPFALPSETPTVIAQSYTTMGSGRDSGWMDATEEGYNAHDNLHWTHGSHQLQGGIEFRRTHSTLINDYNGVFEFLDGYSPILGYTTNAFADYLLGIPLAGLTAQGIGRVNLLERSTYGVFGQDDWKVSSRLTLNLGLRWEYAQPWHGNNDRLGRLGTLDTSSASLAVGGRFLLGGSPDYYIPGTGVITGTGAPGVRESVIDPRWQDFMPRLGFAFRPFNSNRTAIRGGYGMFFTVPDSSDVLSMATSPPYWFLSEFVNILNFYKGIPPYKIDQFFPPPAAGQAGSQGVDPRLRDPRYYQWTLSIQHQLSSRVMVAAEYMGNRGLKLPIAMPINVPGLPNVAELAVLEANPGLNDALAAERMPYTGISESYTYTQSVANSTYNALNLRAEGRFSSRLTFSALYTYSKALDESGYLNTDAPTDPTNLGLNKSYSDFDHPNRFVADWVYLLPFGNMLWKPSNPVVKRFVDGWQLTGIATMQSGGPLNVTVGADTSFRGAVLPVYPDMSGAPVFSNIRKSNGIYLTPQNFVAPPFGQLGMLARNAFHGPGLNNFDLGLLKNIPIREKLSLQFRAEMFNAFNHGQFSGGSGSLVQSMSSPATGTTVPVLNYTDPSLFGRVSAYPSRVAQMALKLIW
jgi:hypothetical protein